MNDFIIKIADNKLKINISLEIYSQDAINQAIYSFTNRCYVFQEPIDNRTIAVIFEPKGEKPVQLNVLVKEFCNELIDQQIRISVNKQFSHIRDEIVKKAFAPIYK